MTFCVSFSEHLAQWDKDVVLSAGGEFFAVNPGLNETRDETPKKHMNYTGFDMIPNVMVIVLDRLFPVMRLLFLRPPNNSISYCGVGR